MKECCEKCKDLGHPGKKSTYALCVRPNCNCHAQNVVERCGTCGGHGCHDGIHTRVCTCEIHDKIAALGDGNICRDCGLPFPPDRDERIEAIYKKISYGNIISGKDEVSPIRLAAYLADSLAPETKHIYPKAWSRTEAASDARFIIEFVSGTPYWYDSLAESIKEQDYCVGCGTPPSYLKRLAEILKDWTPPINRK